MRARLKYAHIIPLFLSNQNLSYVFTPCFASKLPVTQSRAKYSISQKHILIIVSYSYPIVLYSSYRLSFSITLCKRSLTQALQYEDISMNFKYCCLLIVSFSLFGCASIGNNQGYALNYKRNIRNFYAVEDVDNKYYMDTAVDASLDANMKALKPVSNSIKKASLIEMTKLKKSHDHRKSERVIALVPNYISNDPFTLTDPYDVRLRSDKPIAKGDPLAIIINKVRLFDNSETLFELFDNAEIAVVVSIDDGSPNGGKDIIVSYERYIDDQVDLPIRDLLVYYTDNYQNQPIKIAVTIFEFDQTENKFMEGILAQAVNTVAAANPAFSAAGEIAGEIGSFLINQNKNDIIAKLTFQLYPNQKIEHNRDAFGVPIVTFGNSIIINTEDKPWKIDRRKIHVDYDMNAWEYDVSDEDISKIEDRIAQSKFIPHFPMHDITKFDRTPLPHTYVIVTIDDIKMSSKHAKQILDRNNTRNLLPQASQTQELNDQLTKLRQITDVILKSTQEKVEPTASTATVKVTNTNEENALDSVQ